jgi:hypothetical protein
MGLMAGLLDSSRPRWEDSGDRPLVGSVAYCSPF